MRPWPRNVKPDWVGRSPASGAEGLVYGEHHVVIVWVEVIPEVETRNVEPVSYTHLRAHETVLDLVCRLLLEKKKNK